MIWSACLHPCEWREISERWVLLSISAEPVIVSHIVCPAPQTYRKSIIVCFFSSNAKLSFHCKQKWYLGKTNFDLDICPCSIRLNSPLAPSWITCASGRRRTKEKVSTKTASLVFFSTIITSTALCTSASASSLLLITPLPTLPRSQTIHFLR